VSVTVNIILCITIDNVFIRYLTINVISQEIARSRENKVYTTVPKPKVQKKEKSKKSEYHLLF
jgi:hypothetical protein